MLGRAAVPDSVAAASAGPDFAAAAAAAAMEMGGMRRRSGELAMGRPLRIREISLSDLILLAISPLFSLLFRFAADFSRVFLLRLATRRA
ncbi:hypothetical protein PR202_gb21880 [Eleusine coracana subsp. coracana]|uniref:Uncharacterized protein n=1 Tax=Eleusine coracana subsp. coracana TaxID=191504 RepID=A0AAV5FC93_ELECO|nr:hypothetical protein PR202_gb21880 [Eleusine coracana subsp. coracana]